MSNRFSVVPAAYVLLRKNDKVLLIRRANTGYRDGWYSLPAGHIDGGESALQAAVREAKEEIGIDVAPEDLHFVHIAHRMAEEGDHERVDFFFEAVQWRGEPSNCEPEKCDDVAWFGLGSLPEKTAPLIISVLTAIENGSTYSDFGL